MRARLADQAEFALAVLEDDQVFTQDPDAHRPAVFHLGQPGDGVPVAAEQVSPGRPGADPGETLILFDGKHTREFASTGIRPRFRSAACGRFP
jgi:hypothetical protein